MGQTILDFFIFFARHSVLAFVGFLFLLVILDRHRTLGRWPAHLSPASGRRLGVGFCLLLLGLFVGIGAWYLAQDGFAGEVEPLVSSLSWLVQNGEPLYHGLDGPQRYSVLYGPSVFLTNGIILQALGPSLFSVKLASFVGTVGSLVFLYLAAAGSRRDPLALMVTTVAALYFWSQGFAVYLVRPDALLLFALTLALLAVVKARSLPAALTVALMLGFAVNLKIHAVVYFLPVLAIYGERFGWIRTVWILAGSVPVILAPFLFHPQVSAANYIEWLRNALEHGLVRANISATVQFTGFLLVPLVSLMLISPNPALHLKRHAVALAGLAPAYVLTLVLAAKPGAGLVHLLPLVPTTLYLAGLIMREVLEFPTPETGQRRRISRAAVLAAVLMTALLAGSVNAYRAVRLVDWQIAQAPDLVDDVREIMARYPDITIGMACGGEDSNFRHTWLRPLLVFANHPLLVEPIAVMECKLTGKDMPQETFRALENGVVAMWLVPRNQRPFAKLNWYEPHDPIFSTRFIQHFESLYSRLGHSRYFDLWFWNGLEQNGDKGSSFTTGDLDNQELMAPRPFLQAKEKRPRGRFLAWYPRQDSNLWPPD